MVILTMFLLSLLSAMIQLSVLHGMVFRVEVQETTRRNLRRPAATEFQLIHKASHQLHLPLYLTPVATAK